MKPGNSIGFVLVLGIFSACSPPSSDIPLVTGLGDTHVPCDDSNPQRNLYFGDLHVHTALSFDAWVYDVRLEPEGAYRFARGETLLLPPLDEQGEGTVPVSLGRPLDFAAVTDHAEFLGEIRGCTDKSSPIYASSLCLDYREATPSSITRFGVVLAAVDPQRFSDICGDDYDCQEKGGEVWTEMQAAAEVAYDRSSTCSFTAFIGYEWTGATNVSNFHRNVLFRGSTVPSLPITYFEEPTPQGLWNALRTQCLEAGTGCDVLAIPHNSNWSDGNLFFPTYPEGEDEGEAAAFRARIEPVMEIYQHKGDSECMNGIEGMPGATDELCDFEKTALAPWEECGEEPGQGGMAGLGCVHRLDYLRGVLLEGLKEEARLGVNPYPLGVIASTDTHAGTPGRVEEESYAGHLGTFEGDPQARLAYGGLQPGGIINSPGGLAAIWAEENTRESLFDALRRKEVYGTSGPRISLRFFGGWGYPDDLCQDPNLVSISDERGVPMGGELPAQAASVPSFVVLAARDTDSVSLPLHKIQIIKGWLDGEGLTQLAVYDVAGGDRAASVDTSTCTPSGEGYGTLCGVWKDPDWDAAEPAWYYARAVENPRCRWSTWDCLSLPEEERPEGCADEGIPDTVAERAWSSPIWYHPPPPTERSRRP